MKSATPDTATASCTSAVRPRATSLQRWVWVHKWSSLVCTLFMLLLCLTGLPLVFYHEIDHALGKHIEAPEMAAGTAHLPVDRIVESARRHHPDLVPLYLFKEEDEPDMWVVKMDTRPDTDETQAKFSVVDARTGEVLGEPRFDEGFMHLMYRLHVDLFAGLAGRLFLGFMGLLLVVALVSGVVLYAPFMRKLDFGEVRRSRSTKLWWLDMHNMLGIVTVTWALVVGGTGVINTWADLILKAWQAEQVAVPLVRLEIVTFPVRSKRAVMTLDQAVLARDAAGGNARSCHTVVQKVLRRIDLQPPLQLGGAGVVIAG